MEEIEVKFLDINREDIERKLAGAGAVREGHFAYSRYVFDYPDLRLDRAGAWLRLRDEGDSVTLALKQRIGASANDGSTDDAGMDEFEVSVSDMETTRLILLKLGLIEKFYIENRRDRWRLGSVEVDIEEWPSLPPYIEIEGESWDAVKGAVGQLGLRVDDWRIFSTTQIYELHGIRDLDYSRITFNGLVRRAE